MPTYDYKCKACGHRFEEFQSMTAKPLRKCPKCAKNQLERLIGTGAGVLFKGSGFYETDYRSDSYKKAAKAESDSKSGSPKSDDSASSSKKKDSAGASETATPAKSKKSPESAS